MGTRNCLQLVLVLASVAAMLSGCGGGGSGNDAPAGYRLSGTITVVADVAVDSDINDPNAAYQANDNLVQAQQLPNNLITVGGYVNRARQGPEGRSFAAGDPLDVYRVHLEADQTVALRGTGAALSLRVFAASAAALPALCDMVDSGGTRVDTAGDYFIAVVACSGAGGYTLAIGWGAPELLIDNPSREQGDFVPNEVIVQFRDEGPLSEKAAAVGLHPKAGGGTMALLALGEGEERERRLRALGIERPSTVGPMSDTPQARAQVRSETLRLVQAMRARSDVVSADPNYLRRAFATPTDPYYQYQWHYPLINLPAARDVSTGTGAVVAVIDTGVLRQHPDLVGQFANNGEDGYDFIRDPTNALDGDGIDPDWSDPGDQLAGGGTFHGTHVAGIIAAATDNSEGGAGVAGEARIMPLRVLGKDGIGTDYDIIQAINYAAGLTNDSGTLPSVRADIINLSLGGEGYSATAQAAFDAVRQAGVIVIAAAGNDGSSTPTFPAAYGGVIAVSAVGPDKALASYSNYGSVIDVSAPGGDIGRDWDGDGYPDGVLSTSGEAVDGGINAVYRFANGTSMATPHVAGVAALMVAAAQTGNGTAALTPERFEQLLQEGMLTEDLGNPGRDEVFGQGLIDAAKAVQAVQDTAQGAWLRLSTRAVLIENGDSSAVVTVDNGGSEPLQMESVTASAPWLSVTPPPQENGLGSYTLSVDRTDLTDGTYRDTVRFASSANEVVLPVLMRVGRPVPSNAGPHYVVLVEAQSGSVAAELETTMEDGRYQYAFEGVAAGEYLIYAGADLDNDFLICGTGEACGAYALLEQPQRLLVSSDRGGLDFETGYRATLDFARLNAPPEHPLSRILP